MKYLLYFVHRHLNFRLPELESCARIHNVEISYENKTFGEDECFLLVDFPSEADAIAVASRMVLLSGVYEIMACGPTMEEVQKDWESKPQGAFSDVLAKQFKCWVEAFGRKYTQEETVAKMQQLHFIPFEGKVNLKRPEVNYWLFEDIGIGRGDDAPPRMIWFTREIAKGARKLMDRYALPQRNYIGSTSMSAELAFLTANQALVTKTSLALDPFVGTGSIAVSCAHFGATVCGADLDPRVFTGKGPDCNIFTNFVQYGLPQPLGFIRADMALCPWRPVEILDAIVGDPPYGLRESAKKVGAKREAREVPAELRENHIISRVAYSLVDLLNDLLAMGARILRKNGRLAFWFPTTPEYQDADLPRHPCFRLVANSEQVLTTKFRRRLVTYEKIMTFAEFQEKEQELWQQMEIPPPTHVPAHKDFSAKIFGDDKRLDDRHEKRRAEERAAKEGASTSEAII